MSSPQPPSTKPQSLYSRLRSSRIARNDLLLKSLGLQNASQIMSSQKRPTSRNATKRKRKASTDVRSTERIMGRKDDGDVERSEEEIEEEREENIRRKEEKERLRGEKKMTALLKKESKRREQEKSKAIKDLKKTLKECERDKPKEVKTKEYFLNKAKRAFMGNEFEQFMHMCKKDVDPGYTHPDIDPGYPENKKEESTIRKNANSAISAFASKTAQNLKKLNSQVGDTELSATIASLEDTSSAAKKDPSYHKILPP